jgi:PAS domain S-box-containing protein
MTEPAINPSVRRPGYWSVFPWIVLVIGIPISIVLFNVFNHSVDSVARLRFERQASDTHAVIENRLRPYASVLYGLRALFASEQPVSRLRFHRYVESLDLKHRYPGFDVINFAASVPHSDKARFEESVRKDKTLDPGGYPKFSIRPPGERAEYFVIVYLEPMAPFKFAFGLDIGANPAQKVDPDSLSKVQRYARDSSELTASGVPIRVRTAEGEYTGLAMRLAVYRSGMPVDTVAQRRAAYLGTVGAGFNVDKLMNGVLDEKMMKDVRFEVYDAGPTADRPDFPSPAIKRLLFDSNRTASPSSERFVPGDREAVFTHVLPIVVAGRIWEIRFSARKDAVIDKVDQLLPLTVLVGGLLCTLLLYGGLYSLSHSRSRALEIAAQMTKDLRATEERFRLIAENASDLITLFDREGKRVYVNRAYERLFGDRISVIGTDGFQDIHPSDRQRVRESLFETQHYGKDTSLEFRFLLPSGEVRFIESHRSAIFDSHGKVANVVAVARDVTERRHKDEILRLREMQLEEAQAIANLGIWVHDVRKDASSWSEQLYKILGLRRETFRPSREGFLACVHPDDRERVAGSLEEFLRSGQALLDDHYRIVRRDGIVRALDARVHVDRDESGRAVRIVGVCQDVTQRKRAEDRVKASEERFRTMVDNVRDYAIYMLDLAGNITSWNLGAQRISGYEADEVIGRNYSRFFLPQQARRGDPGMQLEFATVQGRYESEGWRVRKDGSHLWAHIIVTPILGEDGKPKGFSEIAHDITERKRAEEDLYNYADRLRATSRRLVEVQEAERRSLAGELHDRVGQNLTALGLNLSIIASGLPPEDYPELAARLEDSHVLVEGTVDAMRDVMAELRPHALDDYGLSAALRALIAGFSRRTGIQVAFEANAPEGILPKPVDLAMFRIAQEALNNVAKHAGARRVEIAFRRRGDHAWLSVADDGVGFDMERSRSSSRGGWGLLIMRERAEAVGAQFSVKARPGSGVEVLVEYRVSVEEKVT